MLRVQSRNELPKYSGGNYEPVLTGMEYFVENENKYYIYKDGWQKKE